jgi:GNAT superfamily N-acetyltransferase
MPINIRPVLEQDRDPLIQMVWLAFEPIFASFKQMMGDDVYAVVYPDWKKAQREMIENFYNDEKWNSYVAELDGIVVGLVVYVLNVETKIGEVELLMVHPDYQRQGIAATLNEFALQKLKEGGMEVAVVGTGGDPSHAAARRSYERAGYTAFPQVWYHKKL